MVHNMVQNPSWLEQKHITLFGGNPVGYFTYVAKNLSYRDYREKKSRLGVRVRVRAELREFP